MGLPPSITATTEFVVPKSIPTILPMLDVDPFSLPKTVYLFVYLDSLSIFVFALLDQYPSFKHRSIDKGG
jgi:hypothetical protein